MLYLIISVFFTSWWALSYKIAFKKNCSPIGVMTVAFGTAAVLALLWNLLILPFQFNYLSATVGTIAGIGLFIAVMSYFAVIKSGARLGVSWTIITLSMIIPTSFSIFLWKEIPTLVQTLGLVFAISGICLLGQAKPDNARFTRNEWGFLFTAFLCTGGINVANKLIPVLGLENFKFIYMLFHYCPIKLF